jgi:asparagine synthetase B (glutamine-hydrolysing)
MSMRSRMRKDLTGMFAFCLWDNFKDELTIGRDRFGEKPLYYGWQESTFFFSSELKSIKSNQLELPLTEGLEPTEKDKEIKEYCEEALSYLIDDGFQVNYFKSEYKYLDSLTRIIITNKNGDFNWERIEDYLPPLLTSLDREYGIKSNTIKLLYHPYKEITLKIKDILKGDFNTNQMLCSVYFDVKNNKI